MTYTVSSGTLNSTIPYHPHINSLGVRSPAYPPLPTPVNSTSNGVSAVPGVPHGLFSAHTVLWSTSEKFPPPAHGLNSAGSLRIPGPAPPSCYPAPLFKHSAPKLGDQLEFCSAMSLLVITHHDSYKYAFITFPFHHVAVAVFR